jgi:hypothetical protein
VLPNLHNPCWLELTPFTLNIQLGVQLVQQKDKVVCSISPSPPSAGRRSLLTTGPGPDGGCSKVNQRPHIPDKSGIDAAFSLVGARHMGISEQLRAYPAKVTRQSHALALSERR